MTVQGGYFGQELNEWLDRAGYTVPEMAELLGVKPPTVYRWLKDSRFIRDTMLTMFLTQCGATAEEIERFKVRNSTVSDRVWGTLGATTDRTSVIGALLRAEFRASRITMVANSVPALFQTSGYASFTMKRAGVADDEIGPLVVERMGRAAMVSDRHEPLELEVFLDEAVLLRPLDSPAATHTQLRHLHACAERPETNVRVVPLVRGWSEMQYGQFNIYDFAEDPSVAYEELHNVMIFLNDPADVEGTYRAIVNRVRPLAMSRDESIGLMLRKIEKVEKLL